MVVCALMVADNGSVLRKQASKETSTTIATAEQALCGRGVR